jgi:uncharacterized membrane protein
MAWAVALFLATWVASLAYAPFLAHAAAAAVYGAGTLICHQLPARSFHLWGVQMPVCARCVGIYAGAAIASVVAAFAGRALHRSTHFGLQPPPLALLAAGVPTALTLVYEWWSGQMPANWIRAAAGVPIGAIVTAVVVAATSDQVN